MVFARHDIAYWSQKWPSNGQDGDCRDSDKMLCNTYYEDTKSNAFFSQLINLKQKGLVVEHIEDFQKLNIRVTDIPEEHRIDLFIGTLKDNI